MSTSDLALADGHRRSWSSREANPELRSCGPLSTTGSRSYQPSSCSVPACTFCLNSSVCISPGTHQAMEDVLVAEVEAVVVGPGRDVGRVAGPQLDHVRGVGVRQVQRPGEDVVGLRVGVVAGVEPAAGGHGEHAGVHVRRGDEGPRRRDVSRRRRPRVEAQVALADDGPRLVAGPVGDALVRRPQLQVLRVRGRASVVAMSRPPARSQPTPAARPAPGRARRSSPAARRRSLPSTGKWHAAS